MKERLMEILDAFSTPICTGLSIKLPERERLAEHLIESGVIVPPCNIGDEVYKVRCYHSVAIAQKGIVSEMKYLPDMRLQIVVKHIGRGKWGEDVFATLEEAEKALAEREGKG
jgi:hypothetical protein